MVIVAVLHGALKDGEDAHRRASMCPTTIMLDLARVRPTLMRCSSATNPIEPDFFVRTVENTTKTFSRPCEAIRIGWVVTSGDIPDAPAKEVRCDKTRNRV